MVHSTRLALPVALMHLLRLSVKSFTLPAARTLTTHARASCAIGLSRGNVELSATSSQVGGGEKKPTEASNHDEVERLRRENAELKAELEAFRDHDARERRESPMHRFRDRLFKGRRHDAESSEVVPTPRSRGKDRDSEALELFRSPRSLFDDLDRSFGALTRPFLSDDLFALDGRGAFAGATDDIGRVREAVVEALKADGHNDVEVVSPPLSQSFSSSSINGKVTKAVALALQVKMDGKQSLVRVKASIDENNDIALDTMYLDDHSLNVRPPGTSSKRQTPNGLVIDV